MSGSFDRPAGHPTIPHGNPRLDATYDTVRTSPATGRTQSQPRPDQERGEGRTKRSARNLTNTPIVPAGSVTGRSLTVVITIMCFLASLTAGAVYMMNQSASAWLRDIASEVTVQIDTRDRAETDKLVAEVTGFLSSQPGIATVKALSVADTSQLLEPWLGQTDLLQALPVPRLIAIELDRRAPPDLDILRAALTNQFPGVSSTTTGAGSSRSARSPARSRLGAWRSCSLSEPRRRRSLYRRRRARWLQTATSSRSCTSWAPRTA